MRAERLREEYEIDVEWQPFELHPEIPLEGKDVSGRTAAYYEQLRGLAVDAGLTFQTPTRVPNSRRSLEAAEFAREHDAFAPYHSALFEAYFSRGQDIGDPAVLAELATAVGLDPDGVREALDSGRYASTVEERTEEARQAGITGTPTFVFQSGDRTLPIVGAQEYAVIENVAQRLGAVRKRRNAEPRT